MTSDSLLVCNIIRKCYSFLISLKDKIFGNGRFKFKKRALKWLKLRKEVGKEAPLDDPLDDPLDAYICIIYQSVYKLLLFYST